MADVSYTDVMLYTKFQKDSPVCHKAISGTDADWLTIAPLGTISIEIRIEIPHLSIDRMNFKMSSRNDAHFV